MRFERDNIAWRHQTAPARRRMPVPLLKAVGLLFVVVLFVWGVGHSRSSDAPVAVSSQALQSSAPAYRPATRPSAPAGGSKTRVAIVTFVTDQRSYLQLSLKNKQHYARRHGYDLMVDYEPTARRGTIWHKFVMLERLITAGQHDWVWWVDFDTLITNTTTSIVDVINEALASSPMPDNVDYVLTNDCNRLNAGSMIVRSAPRSIAFLQQAAELHDSAMRDQDRDLNEQDAMRELIENNVPGSEHHVFIPQNKLNAFPEEIGCYEQDGGSWEPGMFVLHFAGAWAHVKGEDPTGQLMKKYEHEIIWGPQLKDELF